MQVLLMFIIPIKMKWLAYIDMALYAYSLYVGNWGTRIAIIVSLLNFILFFSSIIRHRGYSPKQVRRKMTYKKAVKQARQSAAHHNVRFADVQMRMMKRWNFVIVPDVMAIMNIARIIYLPINM